MAKLGAVGGGRAEVELDEPLEGITLGLVVERGERGRERPPATPTVLGAALFRAGSGLEQPAALAPTLDLVLPFTWLHLLVFCVVGGVASYLLSIAERDPNYGFGVLLLFVLFQIGFVLVSQIFAESVLDALAWPAVLTGNLLAAVAMTAVLWRRHPHLAILP